jgi:hypothetical protein
VLSTACCPLEAIAAAIDAIVNGRPVAGVVAGA